MPSGLEAELAAHPFTEGCCSEAHLRMLDACIEAEGSWDADESIFGAGGDADRCYLILEGDVALSLPSPGSGRRTIQTLGSGDVLGWSWLFPPHRWQFDAHSASPTRAIVLDGAKLRKAIADDADFGLAIVSRVAALMADRLHATRLQLLDLYALRRD